MRRKYLSQFTSLEHKKTQQLSLHFSDEIHCQRTASKHSQKRQFDPQAMHPSNSHRSELKSGRRNAFNTILSSRLFEKAHKVQSAISQTFLSCQSKVKPSNEVKMRDVYQTYIRIYRKEREDGICEHRRKARNTFSDQQRLQNEESPHRQHGKQPFASSLTKIIMNQCKIEENGELSSLDYSQWIDILCEGEVDATRKKDKRQLKAVESENPYELLSIRKDANKENKNPIAMKRKAKMIQ